MKGRLYRPQYDPNYSKVGTASWYGSDFHGLPTANGEVFDKELITAAHPTLPLPSIVRVTNLENGRSVNVRVNDRGPFIGDRLIDLSEAAARKLGYENQGLGTGAGAVLGSCRRRERQAADADGGPCRTAGRTGARATFDRAAGPSGAGRVARSAGTLRARAARAGLRHVCPVSGPQLIQIGAYGETDQVRAAMADVDDLGPLRVEPRVRRRSGGGPRPPRSGEGPASRSGCCVHVVALGYYDAFMVPAPARSRRRAVERPGPEIERGVE